MFILEGTLQYVSYMKRNPHNFALQYSPTHTCQNFVRQSFPYVSLADLITWICSISYFFQFAVPVDHDQITI